MNVAYKKLITIVVAVVMMLSCGIFFNACSCSPGPAAKIMNLSLNPKIEFVLDNNDKVVSANALNDEGNFIISKVDFVGLSAKDATKEFLDASKDNGYLTSNQSANEDNVLKISISGELAEELFNDVKVVADKHIKWIKVSATVQFEDVLDKEYLEDIVLECMKEYTEADVVALSEIDLISLIEESRLETKNILSQEAKTLYYKSRANEIIRQKYLKIKQIISNNSLIAENKKTELIDKITLLVDKITEANDKYEELFIKSDSLYQSAMRDYYSMKKTFLQAKLDKDETQISVCAGNLATLETALVNAKNSAESMLISYEGAVTMALSAVELWLSADNALSLVDNETISQSIANARASYKDTYKSKYQDYVSKRHWETYWSILKTK